MTAAAELELQKLVGAEQALDAFHGALRRGVQSAARSATCGAVLATCSDEFQGELRTTFERDVARPLTSGSIVGQRNVFSLSNMAGRLEVGALELAQQHFAQRQSESMRLLVVEIMAHCGVLATKGEWRYGIVDRFGVMSDCCGALARLIAGGEEFAAVRHPWHEQLSAFFGPERLEALRAVDADTRLLSAAIVHAVLQGESGVADVLRAGARAPTHVFIACGVVLNRPGADTVLPVALHHLFASGREVELVHGASLRSTPQALRFEHQFGRLRVSSDEQIESTSAPRVELEHAAELVEHSRVLHSLEDERSKARAKLAREHLESTRERVARLKQRPQAWRVYARPVLRGLMQTLGVVAPEFGLVAMLVQSGHDATRAQRLRRLLQQGPTSVEARKALQGIEAEIQQLGHRDAQEVLEILLNERSPLLG